MKNLYVVIPNWNGADLIAECLNSLKNQTLKHAVIVVDNGSVDGSVDIIQSQFPEVKLIQRPKNIGFAGGVNTGIRYALKKDAEAIALINNDATADNNWLQEMVSLLENSPETGIVACKLLGSDRASIDSTGDYYTTWGLPYPRGRGEKDTSKYDRDTVIFGASGGASLYRSAVFNDIGLFDEDFFAYYEDVDISFRAQLAGWKVLYAPKAEAYHEHGTTSGKVKGFTTYQTFKNYPLLFWKNVPLRLMPKMLPRFFIAYASIFISSVLSGRGLPAFRGLIKSMILLPKKLVQRRHIQKNRRVTAEYISSVLVDDLPPNAYKLRRLRSFFSRGSRGRA